MCLALIGNGVIGRGDTKGLVKPEPLGALKLRRAFFKGSEVMISELAAN